jgi:hypothetical protein
MTPGPRAKCFLCGLSARQGALQKVGQLHACADEDACDDRRAKRAQERAEAGK